MVKSFKYDIEPESQGQNHPRTLSYGKTLSVLLMSRGKESNVIPEQSCLAGFIAELSRKYVEEYLEDMFSPSLHSTEHGVFIVSCARSADLGTRA